MPSVAASLFWIVACAALAPLVVGMLPGKLVAEVVLLLVGGVVIGPHVLDIATAGSSGIEVLRQLGVAMLFLMAGYEIDTRELLGRGGRRAAAAWIVCLGVAFVVVALLALSGRVGAVTAVAIAMTSTSLGTLLPILKDSGELRTPFGAVVLSHGSLGELGPIVAMSILLSSRGAAASIAVLGAFMAAALVIALFPLVLGKRWTRLTTTVRIGSETTAQTAVRLTVLLVVTLSAVALIFDLDVILGAFFAGFILRRLLPAGHERLESRLDGLAFGFLIPIFFVVSGMGIDVSAVAAAPGVLVAFLVLLVLVRGGARVLRVPLGAPFSDRRGLDRRGPDRRGPDLRGPNR